jgi:CheY-like chemotaxis protein
MAKITLIDDDLAMEVLAENLRFRGHDTKRVSSVSEALSNINEVARSDLIILDVIMALPEQCESAGLSGARVAGMEVFRSLRKKRKTLPIIIYSAIRDDSIAEIAMDDLYAEFISKWDNHPIREILGRIQARLGTPPPPPQIFVVHGQNEAVKYQLKNYLQNSLRLPEPIILHEQPNLGRTIIEKFEDYAARSSLVFVLLTPDDIGASVADPDDIKRRARQNVIFEMGYFLGMLGRRTGRVILLHQGPLELPSDLLGVIYIDITRGIESAGEAIRKELAYVLSTS